MTETLSFGVGIHTMQASYIRPRSQANLDAEVANHAQRAEERGFDTFWLGEHHHSHDGYNPSVIQAAAFLAASTSRITLATAILVLPLHSPERIAESSAAFQAFAPGRLRLAVGIGWNADEFLAAGVDIRRRGKLIETGLERMVSGDLHERMGATEIWSGQHQAVGLGRAARHGVPIIVPATDVAGFEKTRVEYESLFTPGHLQSPRLAMFWPFWIEEDPDRRDWLENREIELLRSAYAHNWVEDLRRGVGDWGKSGIEPAVGTEARRAQRDQLAAARPAQMPRARSASHMVEQLAPFIHAGLREVIFLRLDCTATPEIEEATMDLIAADVAPQLRSMVR